MKKNKGFTLIELLAVIAIIGILAIVIIPNIIKLYNNSAKRSMKTQEGTILNASNLFVTDYCKKKVDKSYECPYGYQEEVNNQKYVCLDDLYTTKYMFGDVKFKNSECDGMIVYTKNQSGKYTDGKTYLYCGKDNNGNYEYVTDENVQIKSECQTVGKTKYNITYTNIVGNFPKKGYVDDTLNINFVGTKYNYIELFQGTTKLSPVINYTFENQLLSIFNVSGDIEIRYTGNFCTENNLTKLNDCIIARDVNEPNVSTAKSLIAAKAAPDFTTIEPQVSYSEKIDLNLNSTNITSTTYEVIYFGTGTPTFDTDKGEWTFTRTHTGSIPEYLSNDTTKYYTCLNTSTSCSSLYVIYDYRTVTNETSGEITYVITEADRYTYKVNSNVVSHNGIYKLEDDYGDTYYYRGIVDNNFVKFGKNSSNQDLYWRIVRVNGDNSIRLIYNGTNTNQTGSTTGIGTSAFNSFQYDSAMIGYTYNLNQVYKETTNTLTYSGITSSTNYVFGTTVNCDNSTKLCTVGGTTITNTWYNFASSWDKTTPYYTCFGIGTTEGHDETTCSIAMQIVNTVASGSDIHKTQAKVKYKGYLSSSYDGITNPIGSTTKDTDSTIKTRIDTWYEQTFKNKSYENYLVDNVFCNDRSIYSGNGQDLTVTTYYAPFRRSYKSGTSYPTFTPSLNCPRQIDEYTVNVDNTRNIGNGKLSYPVGLLTIDEVRAAGGFYNLKNSYYYLYTNITYWVISPSYFGSFDSRARLWFVSSNGYIEYTIAMNDLYVRPVINLNKNVTITKGTGTASDPFEITLN